MKKSQIEVTEEYPYIIRDNEVYCSTLCKNGVWERSPMDEDVKAFKTKKDAEIYANKKNFGIVNICIPYKEYEVE